MKKSKIASLCGIFAGLSVALLFLGTVVWVLAYTMPLVSGLMMIVLIESIDKKSAWVVYAAVSILCLLLMPDKECGLTYTFFFGFYPIIKDKLDTIKPKVVQTILKLLIFNAGIISSQLICIYVFGIPFDNIFGKWGIAILLILANLIFVVYNKLLTVLTSIYDKKYKQRVNRILQ